MTETIKYKGIYRFYHIDPGTKKMKQFDEVENIITDRMLNSLIVALKGLNSSTYQNGIDIGQLAIGDSNTTPDSTDTKLGNEIYRFPKSAQTITAAGELTTEFYMADNEFSGQIEEIGIYGGRYAYDWEEGLFKDWGNLLSRALWSYEKSDAEQIVVQRVDRLTRG
jgi:hypothetical protein